MLERELSAESRRAEALVSKLRAGYKAAERDKAARKAEQVGWWYLKHSIVLL
jgi:hypothetical protein